MHFMRTTNSIWAAVGEAKIFDAPFPVRMQVSTLLHPLGIEPGQLT